jgi:hypothetical protein
MLSIFQILIILNNFNLFCIVMLIFFIKKGIYSDGSP